MMHRFFLVIVKKLTYRTSCPIGIYEDLSIPLGKIQTFAEDLRSNTRSFFLFRQCALVILNV